MTSEEAFKKWMNEEGRCNWQVPVAGYRETPIGISIILQNNTAIPYPYAYNENEYTKLLLD